MKVILYDTTLRDGAQGEGISFSVNDKILIAKKLDELGVHYIEGGWPTSNPKEMSFFKKARDIGFKNSVVVAFGSTRRAKVKVEDDDNIKALLASKTKAVAIFGKSWDMHVKDVFGVSLEENLKMIEDSVRYMKSKGLEVFYDAEHFFDGYKHNPDYALKTILCAQGAGCDVIVLCDTNGGMITGDVARVIREVAPKVNVPLGIHAHNDSGMAVANSVAAVQNGVTHVQGAINGYGERCGNADLCVIIANLKLKLKYDCISDAQLKELTEASRFVSEVSNMKQADNQPFVGKSAFAHKGGVHVDAMIKNTRTYEHTDPACLGNRRRFLISELSGKASILNKVKELDLKIDKDAAKTKKILKQLQDMEHKGYYFEGAEGSFELLLKRAFKTFKRFFELENFRVIIEKRENKDVTSEATIKIKVRGVEEHTSAMGDGPVNALDSALRKVLSGFYPAVSEMHLSDFKVRVLDEKAGTAAKVRVLIQSQDKKDSWWTVGVSENIIEASWQALADSVEYKLLKDKK
ncbi:MAG: citramalate synthase [Candidatus Omnitrophica bacterium CG1_02_49_10]|nr:MAG: citramalate synthase [Candidatus Omnitrophica bacterium CG1_02_49_10]